MISNCSDVFADAREKFTVPQLWQLLGLPGDPKPHGCMHSPFRDERNASFSVFDSGRAWKDQGTGDGGDVVEFVKHALRCDYSAVREWFMHRTGTPAPRAARPAQAPAPRRVIEWPGELVPGTPETWKAFAAKRGLSYRGIYVAVRMGCLRFLRVNGVRCYAVTDTAGRAAEIRRIDGGQFGTTKAYPLRGVDKTWPLGLAMARGMSRESGILIVEGATDFLTAIHLYAEYRKDRGVSSWIPTAILGAGCKTLAPESISIIRGRRVRIVPDADDAGDKMRDHWREVFHKLGCTVDVVRLPRGKDLTDMRNQFQPWELFDAGN